MAGVIDTGNRWGTHLHASSFPPTTTRRSTRCRARPRMATSGRWASTPSPRLFKRPAARADGHLGGGRQALPAGSRLWRRPLERRDACARRPVPAGLRQRAGMGLPEPTGAKTSRTLRRGTGTPGRCFHHPEAGPDDAGPTPSLSNRFAQTMSLITRLSIGGWTIFWSLTDGSVLKVIQGTAAHPGDPLDHSER